MSIGCGFFSGASCCYIVVKVRKFFDGKTAWKVKRENYKRTGYFHAKSEASFKSWCGGSAISK